ncbi:MAG: hypothetical protein AB7L66_09205 [Gemmatimonadales bacterium]
MVAGPPRILLADCDQMFVAVARLVDPEGAGKAPLLVVGGSAASRGVVCSASYEARTFGVRSGMPIARAARLCPGATFVPVPRHECGRKSREVARVLDQWSPTVEAASIDEFYLDLSGTEALYHHEPLETTAARIRAAALETTGLSISFGGGTNRLVAKLAAERAKPKPGTGGTGVHIVPPGQEAAFLATHDLADIPGVGPKLQARLATYGLTTVQQALAVERRSFEDWLGPRSGGWLFERIRGRGSSRLAPREPAKSMSREETFAADISDDGTLDRELVALVNRLTAQVRAEGLRARHVGVKLRDFDFKTRQASRTLERPVETNRAVLAVARELLAGLRRRRRVSARLLGVALSRFEEEATVAQLDLLVEKPVAAPRAEGRRDRVVAGVMDRINEKFGRNTVVPAVLTRGPAEDRS